MVFLDVVYNHFGPDGNYLRELCADLLHRAAQDAVGRRDQLRWRGQRRRCATSSSRTRCTGSRNFTSMGSGLTPCMRSLTTVRDAYSAGVRANEFAPRFTGRQVHLILENDENEARRLARRRASGRPAATRRNGTTTSITRCMSAATGESSGYYAAYRGTNRAARPRARRRLRLSGRIHGLSRQRRAANRAPSCRRAPSSPSSRTTIRSATAPSANAFGALASAEAVRAVAARLSPHSANADAVHGRGMGRGAALSVLLRLRREIWRKR